MIPLSPKAEAQIDALLGHYERLGRIEASRNLLTALESASSIIEHTPNAGLSAPRPYPSLAKPGRAWVKSGRYWIMYSTAKQPIITGIFYEAANIPRRIK